MYSKGLKVGKMKYKNSYVNYQFFLIRLGLPRGICYYFIFLDQDWSDSQMLH